MSDARPQFTPQTSPVDQLDPAALRRQDTKEFEMLVKSLASPLASLCQSMGLRGQTIDDALAESLAAIYSALPRFESRSLLSTFTYRIAVRTILRVRTRYPATPSSPAAAIPASNPTDPHSSPPAAAEQSETNEQIWAAVAQLPPNQAAAIHLFYRDGLSVDQIAHTLDCPTGTIKTHLSRARDTLRAKLQKVL